MSDESRVTRRGFVGGATLTALGAALVPRALRSTPLAAGGGADVWELYVGTYTANTQSRGIYRLVIDADRGEAVELSVAAECENPSFLALSPDRRRVVAVNELEQYEGKASGAVTCFARDTESGALSAPSRRASLGGAPCYVSIDARGRHALVANYLGGNVAVFPIAVSGSLGAASAKMQHVGHGADSARQEGPHAHCVLLDVANRFAFVADLGIDRIKAYRFDAERGTLMLLDGGDVVLPPGTGPRHLAWSPDGRTMYVTGELASTLTVLDYDSATGILRARQELSLRPAGATGANAPADVHVHPTGRFVYASNRGDNTIAVFRLDRTTRALALVQSAPCGGDWPRNFALDPTGRLLLVAHQRSDSIVAFAIDPQTGRLTATGARIAIPAPVCLRFVEETMAPR
jgi:6-phosphogluconolactonase